MSGLGSNHDYYHPQTTPTETEDEPSDIELLPDLFQPEYASNTFQQQDQYWSSTVSHPPAPQIMSPPHQDLPLLSTQEAARISEARAKYSGRNLRRLLPALPSNELRHKNTHPDSTQGNITPGCPETSLTPWPSHRPTDRPYCSDQTTVLSRAPTLNPLRTNNENHLPESPSSMNLSPQTSLSTHNKKPLRCTWSDCRYEGTFNRPKDLERHMETQHTNKSSHECHFEDCDSTYNRKDNLTAHLRRKHSSRR